jgi:hypothetical protein
MFRVGMLTGGQRPKLALARRPLFIHTLCQLRESFPMSKAVASALARADTPGRQQQARGIRPDWLRQMCGGLLI